MTDTISIGLVVLQAGIVVALLEALRRRDIATAVNALVSFIAVLLPVLVESIFRSVFAQSVGLGPELPLWIAAAGCLHSFGMLGPYDSVWWWDNLTHMVSAALVAALIYAGLIVIARHSSILSPSSSSIAALTILFTFAVGVFWELIELVAREAGRRYDIEPVFVHCGWRDTALDLVFDLVGALLVLLFDLRIFVPIADQVPDVTRTVILGSGLVIVVGSVLMALSVELGRDATRE
jgi:hypothetical protein